MKKKIIAIMLGGLMLGMTACGSASQEAVETVSEAAEQEAAEETVAEETTEEDEEADTAASEEAVSEEETEEDAEAVEEAEADEADFTLDEAFDKLIQYLNVHIAIFENNDFPAMNTCASAADCLNGFTNFDYSNMVTKDGFQGKVDDDTDDTFLLNVSIGCEFYYNFVNNGEYMSVVDYTNDHTYDEIVNKYFKTVEDGTYDGTFYCADIIMFDAIYLAQFMEENKDYISSDALITEAPFIKDEVSGVKVAYELPLHIAVDGDEDNEANLSVLFDKDGNMLNIVGESEEYEISLHRDGYEKWENVEGGNE